MMQSALPDKNPDAIVRQALERANEIAARYAENAPEAKFDD